MDKLNEKLIEKLVGFDPRLVDSQQYVVWCMEDDEYKFLYDAYPPQVAPLRWAWERKSVKFRVFSLSNILDMQALASVWHHSSQFHKEPLKLMTVLEMSQCFNQALSNSRR